MHLTQYNDRVTLGYEYVPIIASANVITGTKYRTKVYLVQGSAKYDLGAWDEKLDEEQIKARFGEIIRNEQERQYGQQGTVLRRDLTPIRQRGRVGSAIQQAAHRAGIRP